MIACCPQILRAVFFPLSVKQRGGTAYNKDIVIKDKKIKKCCKRDVYKRQYMAYKAVNKGEDDKVSTALSRMMEEDQTLKVVNDAENRQALLYGIGDQQLDVVVSKLQSRYKVDITLTKPKFAFRETLRKKVKVDVYKRQT